MTEVEGKGEGPTDYFASGPFRFSFTALVNIEIESVQGPEIDWGKRGVN